MRCASRHACSTHLRAAGSDIGSADRDHCADASADGDDRADASADGDRCADASACRHRDDGSDGDHCANNRDYDDDDDHVDGRNRDGEKLSQDAAVDQRGRKSVRGELCGLSRRQR